MNLKSDVKHCIIFAVNNQVKTQSSAVRSKGLLLT